VIAGLGDTEHEAAERGGRRHREHDQPGHAGDLVQDSSRVTAQQLVWLREAAHRKRAELVRDALSEHGQNEHDEDAGEDVASVLGAGKLPLFAGLAPAFWGWLLRPLRIVVCHGSVQAARVNDPRAQS
jgi:hypothetical protein